MNDTASIDIEDIGTAIRESRPLRTARQYRFAITDSNISFRPVMIADPVPTGRQILATAGFEPVEEFSLFAILPAGDFEDVRLDETFDLREKGVERFIAFRSDRTFKLTLNDHELRWGEPKIKGSALYALGNVPADRAVLLDTRGGDDRLIKPDDEVDLTGGGVERFITAPRPSTTFEIFVNGRPRQVTGSKVTFEQVVELAFPGPHEPNVEFSMTFNHAASTPTSGELGRGGYVIVKNGTQFNVTRTVQS